MPIAAVVYLADVVAGVPIYQDPDFWAFTSELSVRVPSDAAAAVHRILVNLVAGWKPISDL